MKVPSFNLTYRFVSPAKCTNGLRVLKTLLRLLRRESLAICSWCYPTVTGLYYQMELFTLKIREGKA